MTIKRARPVIRSFQSLKLRTWTEAPGNKKPHSRGPNFAAQCIIELSVDKRDWKPTSRDRFGTTVNVGEIINRNLKRCLFVAQWNAQVSVEQEECWAIIRIIVPKISAAY
jgi:hypothetical protein